MRALVGVMEEIDSKTWIEAFEMLQDAYMDERQVWVAGNGGNAANAFHFATDWNKGLFVSTGKALKTRTLNDNPAMHSAFVNDYKFESSFAEQLQMFAKKSEVCVLLTAGGSSRNILEAANKARDLGLQIIGLTGGDGLMNSKSFDVHVHVPSHQIQIVEDIHAIFGHMVYDYIKSHKN